MSAINKVLLKIVRRAEKSKLEHLIKSFVDVGPTYTLLSSPDNQIMFGRRGTGKTHFLAVLNNEISNKNILSISIDMRLIGSTGGIFSDHNIPKSERATRLLSDTLCEIHENIIDKIFNKDLDNSPELIILLDDLLEQSTAVTINGIEEEELSHSKDSEGCATLKTDFSLKSISLGLSSAIKNSSSSTSKNKSSGIKTLRLHIGTITKLLKRIVNLLPSKELWLLIDEWSEVPLDLQPYLAELLRRVFFSIPGITVKIAAISHRCNFMEQDPLSKVSFGIELGSDAASIINLDEHMVFDNDSNSSKEFFKKLLHNHASALDISNIINKDLNLFIKDTFSQTSSFDEYVRSVEGVPRDAINIIGLAAKEALENTISVAHIRTSAHKWFQQNKLSAINSRQEALDLLDKIITEVIGQRKTRGFMIRNDKTYSIIDYLYDMRIIHVLKQGVSSKNTIGIKYTLYALDYGCYVQLISTKKAPLGLLIETDENNEQQYIDIPKSDYRSLRSSILNLDIQNNQFELRLTNNIDDLQIPINSKKSMRSVEKTIGNDIVMSIPKNLGIMKISGTQYIPIILVAMVLRKAKGHEVSYAKQLTDVINEFMEISANRPKIATNNLSREFRKGSILALPWLNKHDNDRRPHFSLNEKWTEYWEMYFEESAPNL